MAFTKRLTLHFSAAVVALLAWVLNAVYLYWMAGVLLLLPWLSRLVARLELRGLELARRLPRAGHQGETVTVRLEARNGSRLPKLHLLAVELAPPGLELPPEPLPLHLPPLGRDVVAYPMRLARRGVHRLPGLRVECADLLGLASEVLRVELPAEITVYPRVVPLPEEALPPDLGGGDAPVSATSRKGEGAGFFGVREYRPGDPLRHVHWRTAARAGRLAVVEWEAEEAQETLLAIETARGTERALEHGTTLDLAAGLAASLASLLLARGEAVRLLASEAADVSGMSGSVLYRGTAALPEMLERLARLEAAAEAPLAAALRSAAPRLAAGARICWFTPAPLGAEPERETAALLETARLLRAARLRPVLYALIDAPRPDGAPPSQALRVWEAAAAHLEGIGVPVLRFYRDDELVRQHLD